MTVTARDGSCGMVGGLSRSVPSSPGTTTTSRVPEFRVDSDIQQQPDTVEKVSGLGYTKQSIMLVAF